MDLIFFIIYTVAIVCTWEYFGMGLAWHGLHLVELTTWGRADIFNVQWSWRLGPVEIYRM